MEAFKWSALVQELPRAPVPINFLAEIVYGLLMLVHASGEIPIIFWVDR
jgi:hypothetical protein